MNFCSALTKIGMVCAALLLCVAPKTMFAANGYTGLFSFTGATGSFPGTGPIGTFVLSGSTLYGVARNGGAGGNGVLYSYNTANDTYTELVSFTDVSGLFPGFAPNSVIPSASGTVLYGTTYQGGVTNLGVLYSYDLGTNTYTELLNFTGASGAFLGQNPISNLVLVGSTLYGVASGGLGSGVLFSYNLGSNAYTLLVEFSGTTGSFFGSDPNSLVLSGNTLYGTTITGGASNFGVLFSYNLVTFMYNALINFTGTSGAALGQAPNGPLVVSGSTLYGTTQAGGINGLGAAFSYDITTTTYTPLFSFTGSSVSFPGDTPEAGLSMLGTVLYGTTNAGGNSGDGVLFSYDTASSTYTELFNFVNTAAAPGSSPAGAVTPIGNVLYGTANGGGTSLDGVLFSFAPSPQQGGGYAGKKKKRHRHSHHPRPAPTRSIPKYKTN
ncbi:MAG TPA: choice-of-anchor tandem repeat GloVer-containing protein [Rhabdochlamydiaceae bacterium]